MDQFIGIRSAALDAIASLALILMNPVEREGSLSIMKYLFAPLATAAFICFIIAIRSTKSLQAMVIRSPTPEDRTACLAALAELRLARERETASY